MNVDTYVVQSCCYTHSNRVEGLSSLEVRELVQVLQKIDLHWGLWLGKGVVTFVEVLVVSLDVAFRSEAKRLAPETVGLAVGERENIYCTCDSMEGEL